MLNNNWASVSPVQIYVQRACEPSLAEPNYALNLELADHITKKKGNTPRETAMAVVNQINQRNPHVSLLAISLLHTLVQTVGYPFHLQIATKEFLNELVRRFPERPPPFPGPVMSKILETIHEWKETICKDSRWREDLGNIRDMHRLLTYKGYRFKDASKSTNYAAAANANLKSPEELEEEDREAQQAKLQELIRRGTPRDLAAAQELMKSLSGANPDAKPDYKKQTMHELEKLQAKVMLLNDLLDNVDKERGERFVAGDAYDQVATICRQARPKIQKWISDAETDDPESLENFLSMNDLINNILARYDRYQKGDFSDPPPDPTTYNAGAGGGQKKNDLIDFDLEDSSAHSAAPSGSGVDDLAELFGPSSSGAQPQQHVASNNHSKPMQNVFSLLSQPQPQSMNTFGSAAMGQQPTPFGWSTPGGSSAHNQNAYLGGIALPTTPNNSQSPPAVPGAMNTPPTFQQRPMQFSTPPLTHAPQQPQQPSAPTTNSNSASKAKDPFDDLVGLF